MRRIDPGGLRPGRALSIRGMLGLGDNIMQRPFVRAAAAREPVVYLSTPWPELYADLDNVRPVRSQTRLRTQARNERQWAGRWWGAPGGRQARFTYGGVSMPGLGIQAAMERCVGLGGHPFVWDLPKVGQLPDLDTGGKPIALVRPVTERAEWHNSARSPLPEYVNAAAERLAGSHYVIAIADLQPGQEWLVGPMPVCDLALMRGELSTMDMLALMRAADVVIGGVGWILPAALAMRSRAFIYFGGQGGHNAPEIVIDPRADSSRLGIAVPSNFCRCREKQHHCDKRIDGALEQFEAWAAVQGVRLCSSASRRRTARAG